MSWKFPKFPVKNTQVVDLEDMNANFEEFAEELGGQLNEHNWKEGAISSVTTIDKDAAFVWHSAGDYVQTLTSWPQPNTAQDAQLVSARPVWTSIENSSVTFTSPSCLLWIHGSVQINQGAVSSGTGLPSNTGTLWSGNYFVKIQLAIRLDNYVIPESIIGSEEVDNDYPAGVRMPMMPLVTSIAFPIATGSHTVELVVRTIGTVLEKGTTLQNTSPKGFYISNREIITLEMRR